MTVCVAALYGDGHDEPCGVVVASDRMVTADDSEFEQDTPKIHSLTETCFALSAGSALHQVELIRAVRTKVTGNRNPRVAEVVEACKEQFVEMRRTIAEDKHLRPLGFDLRKFMSHHDALAEGLALSLTRQLEHEELELDLLIAGVDAGGAHIYMVKDPGESLCFDAVGFCAIGSGERHAELIFMRSEYSPRLSIAETAFLVYQAKREAEMAPGVGSRYTDIGYINDAGHTLF